MNVNLIAWPSMDPDYLAGTAAATCTGSSKPEKALKHSLGSGHESVAEHANFTFKIEGVSRVLLAQLTRHRIASFSVKSQRYCKVDEGFYIPESLRDSLTYKLAVRSAFDAYRYMLNEGIPEEDARYVLPQCCFTDLVVTMNARELRHFFKLRCCNRAQSEIRELADRMYLLVKNYVLFEDCGPGCVCDGMCPEKRPCGHPRTSDDLFKKEEA